ncbi:MAG: efflux RND transporter periplasmic adaptor subunit [Acidobacteriota bacterium]
MTQRHVLLYGAVLCLIAGAWRAQASPVRFTTARSHEAQQTLRLTGSVEARQIATVATEVAGVVAQLLTPEGSTVRRGAPLVRLRRKPIELRHEAARGQLAEAEARLKSAELRLERTRELRASEVVSTQQVDDATYDTEAWRGRVAQLRAEVATLERDLDNTTVRASFHGVVGREHVQVGEWLDVGDPVVELISLDALEVRLEVPERHFGGLAPGARATVRFESLANLEVEGSVRAVVPRADPRARTFPVLIRVPNEERRIGVGMLARVDLALGRGRASLLVPKDAVVKRDGEDVLFVIEGETVRRVPVTPGLGVGQWLAVEGELQAEDRVVTHGNELLQDGQEVTPEAQDYPPPEALGTP